MTYCGKCSQEIEHTKLIVVSYTDYSKPLHNDPLFNDPLEIRWLQMNTHFHKTISKFVLTMATFFRELRGPVRVSDLHSRVSLTCKQCARLPTLILSSGTIPCSLRKYLNFLNHYAIIIDMLHE